MKKVFLLIIVWLTVFMRPALAQTETVISKEVSAYENKSYVAFKSITLLPGFEFSAGYYSFSAVINPVMDLPVPTKVITTPAFTDLIVLRKQGVRTWGDAVMLAANEKMVSRKYVDGLGRPIQQIDFNAGGGNKPDLVSFAVYDQFGREKMQYLSYAENTGKLYQASPITAQATFYSTTNTSGKYAKDNAPYAESLFDNSPINMVLQQGSAGTSWQLSTGKIKSMISRTNTTGDNVRLFATDGTSSGFYAAGVLSVAEQVDEENRKVIVFSKKDGNVILKREWFDETIQGSYKAYKETYYVYHEFGMPIMVIPPKVTDRLKANSWTWTGNDLNEHVYLYEYDSDGRMSGKKAPSGGWIYMVYDNLDRVSLVQTAAQRLTNKWNFVKYDKANRVVLDGILKDNTRNTRALMQTHLSSNFNYIDTNVVYYESRGGTQMGYTDVTFPQSSGGFASYDVLNAYYYDSYDTDNNGTVDYSYTSQSLGADEPVVSSASGKIAVLKSRKLGSPDWISKVYFYDVNGLLVQERSNNITNATVGDLHTNVFNFDGTLKKSVKKKTIGATLHTVTEAMAYDNGMRLSSISHQYNSNTAVTIAEYNYNELGQLVDRNLGKLSPGVFLQSVDLRYNIKGWITGINNSGLNNDGYNEETNDVFGMDILYNESSDISNTALFNGKVSGVKWKSVMTSHPFTNIARSYAYSYDKLGQLRKAYFKANNGSGWNYRNDTYSEKNISYDLNGNILALRRNTMNLSTGALIAMDSLTYAYKDSGKGDKLQTVNDTYGAAGSYGFKGVSTDAEEYVYDEDGRLKQDKNKNMTYFYNDIGKVDSIAIGTKYIKYTYSASGELLSKKSYNGSSTTTTNYADSFTANGNVLSFILNAEGRVRTAAGVGTYEYFIKDHQGNVRVSFENQSGVAVVRQENSYYAFGMVHSATVNVTDANKQLYNGGSEWQDDFDDDPDLMNTPLRQYDPVLGRFNAIDPLADVTAELNGYSFAFNDPVMFNDPSGAYPDPPYRYNSGGYPYNPYTSSLEEDWYQRSFDGWLRNQYYSAGMGDIWEQQYGYNSTYGYTKKVVGYIDLPTLEKVDGSPVMAAGINRVAISEYVRKPSTGLSARHYSTAGSLALMDGPEPFIMDAVAGAYLGVVWYMNGGKDMLLKMSQEIDRIYTRTQGPRGNAYELRVNLPGTYRDVRGNLVTLNAGDIWKYGETTKGNRYTQNDLNTMVPGGVYSKPLYYGTQIEIKVFEKYLIYGYYFNHGTLPPGNKIFR